MPIVPTSEKISKQDSGSTQNNNYIKTSPKYTFSDLILDSKTLEELETVVSYQRCWKKVFETWGLANVMKERKNLFVNLYGAPETGKTMAAHAIASELNKELICVNYADIESKYVGETSKNLKNLFENPDNLENIIFFDEADALLSKRVTDMSSATDVSVNQTRSVLLTLLNSYEGIVIFATNFISNYDAAFMRRIQYHILFELPGLELREKLWNMYIPQQMPVNADKHILAEKYDGLSGSDISTAVMKAALRAARKNSEVVIQEDFEEAVNSILKSRKANNNSKEHITRVTEIVPEEEVPEEIRIKAEN